MNIVVRAERENQALETKRQIRVFYCDAVHLSLSELVVFSHRAYQDEYAQQVPHRKQVARAVGLSADTVSRADRGLMRLGLLDCNLRARQPTDDMFRRKRKPDGTRHWRHGLLSWTQFVRSSKCGLSPLSMAVWSYVAHCAATHWQPRGGLGASYLAVILRANRAAVQRVLGQLEGSGLLVRRDGCWCPVASKDWSWLAAHHVLRHAVLPGDRGAASFHLGGIKLDARGGEHSLEPSVEILEHGVVLGVLPLGLVDDQEDVGAVAVGAGLDVAAGEEVVPQAIGELHRLPQAASFVRHRCL